MEYIDVIFQIIFFILLIIWLILYFFRKKPMIKIVNIVICAILYIMTLVYYGLLLFFSITILENRITDFLVLCFVTLTLFVLPIFKPQNKKEQQQN